MSGIGNTKVNSMLPEDIEQKLRDVQNIIANLINQKDSLELDISNKKIEQAKATELLNSANLELARVTGSTATKNSELNDREVKLSQKESALDVYANALKEKEERINKYLNIFERMKDVVIK